VQDDGAGGAPWALGHARIADHRDELGCAWTLRAAPHADRRADLGALWWRRRRSPMPIPMPPTESSTPD